MELVKKVWGWELILISTELYACKLLILKGGYQCSIHYHKEKDETFMLLAGQADIQLNKNMLSKPFVHFATENVVPYQQHRFVGKSIYSIILEVSTQDKPEDSYRDTVSGKISS